MSRHTLGQVACTHILAAELISGDVVLGADVKLFAHKERQPLQQLYIRTRDSNTTTEDEKPLTVFLEQDQLPTQFLSLDGEAWEMTMHIAQGHSSQVTRSASVTRSESLGGDRLLLTERPSLEVPSNSTPSKRQQIPVGFNCSLYEVHPWMGAGSRPRARTPALCVIPVGIRASTRASAREKTTRPKGQPSTPCMTAHCPDPFSLS